MSGESAEVGSGTSIFDPVVCEFLYRWFCRMGGRVLDPFAGGSVRGIVAGVLGRRYVGVDLSERQIDANREQAAQIARLMKAEKITAWRKPEWVVGNSENVGSLVGERGFDFLFSCPPYFDLELYSDKAGDLSNMSWDGFTASYRRIVRRSLRLLNNDCFACFVVGDVRGKDHMYRNLPALTVQAFAEAGAWLYNDAILVTAVASLPLRCRRVFDGSRKLAKGHQNVMIFVKGDWKKAVAQLSNPCEEE